MKITTTTASIEANTNRMVSSTEVDWSILRPGASIRFQGDSIFYTVNTINQFFYIKDFEVISGNKIRIKDDIGVNLCSRDIISISYKEYELLSIFEILNKGSLYKVGDSISPDGGDTSYNVAIGSVERTVFNVTEVDEKGGIISVGLLNKGRYVDPPPDNCKVIGGSGAGAEFGVKFKLIDNRKIVERSIEVLDDNRVSGVVYLNTGLERGIKEGKISCHKNEAFLDRVYPYKRINHCYDIIRDFTPNYGFPFALPNGKSNDISYNCTIAILDAKIKQMEERITQLENR